jgi:hypothetical protein
MKDKFRFKLNDDLAEENDTINEYAAVRHPEVDDLFIVTWEDKKQDEGWDSVVYEEETIENNIKDGSWILID